MEGSLATAIDLKVSASQLWDIFKSPEIIPKLLPDYIAGSEFIEGDGGVGSIRIMKFGPAVASFVTFSKEKIEVMDETAKKVEYSVIDGELLNYFKVYKVSVTVVQGETEDSCIINWSVKYEPMTPEIPPPEVAKQGAISTFKALEAFMLAGAPKKEASQDGPGA